MCYKPTKDYKAKEDFMLMGCPIKKGMILHLNEDHLEELEKDGKKDNKIKVE